MTRRPTIPTLAVLALGILGASLLSILLTWPTAARLDAAVLGSPDADGMKHLWTLWWTRSRVLVDHASLFQNPYFNHPAGMEFWPIEPLNGLLAVLLGFLPLIAATNLTALLNLTLTGLCGALLGWDLTRSSTDRGLLGALLGGLVLQASSFSLYSLHVGVGELQHLWILPLGIFLQRRLVLTLGWGHVISLGLTLGVGSVACFYYGLFLALALLVLGVIALLVRPRQDAHPWRLRARLLLRLCVAALLAGAVAWPALRAFSTSYGQKDIPGTSLVAYVFEEGHGQPLSDPPSARLQPEHLVQGRASIRQSGGREERAYGGGRLLGVPLLLVSLVALARRPREAAPLLAVALVGLVLALGSYLSTDAEDVLVSGRKLRLPFLFLNRLIGFGAEPVHFPVRFLTHVALAAMASLALSGLTGPARLLLLGIGLLNPLDVHWRQSLPYPLPSFVPTRLDGLDVASVGSPRPRQGNAPAAPQAVFDLSAAWRPDVEARFVTMSAQMLHGRPIQAIPIERLEFYASDGPDFVDALELSRTLAPLYGGLASSGEPTDARQDLFLLQEHGFAAILVTSIGGRENLSAPLRRMLTALCGEPLASSDNYVLHAIPEVTATEEERAAWRAALESRWTRRRRAPSSFGPQRR
jgi:hypothetical protein